MGPGSCLRRLSLDSLNVDMLGQMQSTMFRIRGVSTEP